MALACLVLVLPATATVIQLELLILSNTCEPRPALPVLPCLEMEITDRPKPCILLQH